MKKDMSKLVMGIINKPLEENEEVENVQPVAEQKESNPVTRVEPKAEKPSTQETVKPTPIKRLAPLNADDAISRAEEWEHFRTECMNYSKSPRKGVSLWIDDDIADLLNELKNAEHSKVFLRHMVNAMCSVFIQNHKEEIKKAILANKKKNPFL